MPFISQLEFGISGLIAVLLMPLRMLTQAIALRAGCGQLSRSKKRFESLVGERSGNSDLIGKICIVTGSNTGIGKRTAARLASLGCSVVVLACRDPARGEEAKNDIIRSLASSASGAGCVVDYIPLDLSSLNSVHQFAKHFSSKYDRLDILVNNAGLNSAGSTADGLQTLFQVNYLGHYLLTRLLLPLLSKARNSESNDMGRVVNLSSVMHHSGQCDFKKSAYSRFSTWEKYTGCSYYSDSKLYMNFLTMELNRRFYKVLAPSSPTAPSDSRRTRPVLSVSVNPGAVRSDIWRGISFGPVRIAFELISKLLFLDTEDGSSTSVFACAVPPAEINALTSGINDDENDFKSDCKWRSHKCLPYFSPYVVPKSSFFGKLAFELFGPFEFPTETEVSLPAAPQHVAASLWEFSANLCESVIGVGHLLENN